MIKAVIKRPTIKVIKRQATIKAVLGRGVGIPGPPGAPGEQGPPGEGDKNFTMQFTNQSVIVVEHNLGKYPSVVVFDSTNDEVEGNIIHDSINQLTITFSASFTGRVVCN